MLWYNHGVLWHSHVVMLISHGVPLYKSGVLWYSQGVLWYPNVYVVLQGLWSYGCVAAVSLEGGVKLLVCCWLLCARCLVYIYMDTVAESCGKRKT